jgi:hypothetical protein
MKDRLASLATIAGYLGAVLFVIALVGRFYGENSFLGFKAMNVFMSGIGVITWGIWARLESK